MSVEEQVEKQVEKQVANIEQQMDRSTGFNENVIHSPVMDMWSFHVPVAKDIAPWWSRTRDAELRAFWKDGQQGSGIMYKAQTKIAALPLRVIAKDPSITAHVKQAKTIEDRLKLNSGFGAGIYDVLLPFSEDYLGQDNGAFLEILGDGQPDGPIEGPVIGLRHLDSSRCQRTGHPIYPVLYTGDDGLQYMMHAARVLFLSQMPSSQASMHGVGFCSVSRSLRILQNLQHIVNYKDEKMGARAASQILVGTGITGRDIIKAMAASEAMLDNLGLSHMVRTTALGSAGGEVDLKKIDLNKLDPFDEEATYTYAAYALALSWGLEFQEIIPVQSSRGNDMATLQRSRGMLPQAYRTAFQQQANIKLVPDHLEVVLDYYDDMQDQQRAVIEDIFSRNLSRQIDSGYTTPTVVQEKLHQQGYLNDSQLKGLKLSQGFLIDNSPVQSVFFDPSYDDLITIPKEMIATLSYGDTEKAQASIEANKVYIYSLIGQRRSSIFRDKANDALAALDWLYGQYNLLLFRSSDEEEELERAQEEDTQEEASDEETRQQDGRLTNSEAGEDQGVGKATDFFTSSRDYLLM